MLNALRLDRPLKPLAFLGLAVPLLVVELAIKALLLGDILANQFDRSALVWGTGLVLFGRPPGDTALLIWFVTSIAGSVLTMMLALRRVQDARWPAVLAVVAMIPLFRLVLVPILSILPSAQTSAGPTLAVQRAPVEPKWHVALAAVASGAALAVAGVGLGGVLFGVYGYALYAVTPILVGAAAGYIVNRDGPVGTRATARAVWYATIVASMLLVAVALEGVICLVIALPLTYVLALVGSALGCAVAATGQDRRINAAGLVLILPGLFALERLTATPIDFEVTSEIHIAAPSAAVWRELIGMERVAEQPGLLFRLGVAHPLKIDLQGTGVGSLRLAYFSTGIAVERVTVWEERREFAFEVIEEPPTMRELSPYEHVHAPHTQGYFRTLSASYRLEALADGSTRLIETSRHALHMQPYEYWIPVARWVIGATHQRVLRQVRTAAEKGSEI